ncbi:hypothetical protein GCM10009812_32100 [Nocardioides marinus]
MGQATGGTRSPGSGSPETGRVCSAEVAEEVAVGEDAVDMGLQIVGGPAMVDKPGTSVKQAFGRGSRPGAAGSAVRRWGVRFRTLGAEARTS